MKKIRITILLIGIWALATCVFPYTALAQDGAISSISFDNVDSEFDTVDNFDIDDDWDEYEELLVKDPYEKYNRIMFTINNKIYKFVFSPLSKGYDFLIPKKVQGSLNNVIRLTSTPKRFFNNLFQKKPKMAFIELERLLINASLGLGGIFDPAKGIFHLEQHSEDFGQTLGSYGVGAGSYIIWPIVGPSTSRDAVGLAIDTAFSPFLWFGIYDVESQDAFKIFGITKRVNNYSYNVRDSYNRITESAIDPYIALQNAYIQNRQKRIAE